MALDPTLGTNVAEQGQTTMRASFINAVSFPGDDAYPTGGTPNAQQFFRDLIGDRVTVMDVVGYGYAAGGALTHFVEYDNANDTLIVRVLAGTEVVDTTDISATTFRVTVFSR